MNKKLLIETDNGYQMIPVDNLYFKTDNRKGIISCSQNLNHAYSIEIIKVNICIYKDDAKRKVMKRLFNVFLNALDACKEILTIEQSVDGVLYFKDGQDVLKVFNPENQQFSRTRNINISYTSASKPLRVSIHELSDVSPYGIFK